MTRMTTTYSAAGVLDERFSGQVSRSTLFDFSLPVLGDLFPIHPA